MCDGPHADFPNRATLAAPKGEWPYTEETPSGAAQTSPPEGVFRHKRLMELDELSGRSCDFEAGLPTRNDHTLVGHEVGHVRTEAKHEQVGAGMLQ